MAISAASTNAIRRFYSELARCSPFNTFHEGHVLVVLRSYFDGNMSSNDAISAKSTLTLAGYVSDDATWAEFEQGWREMLATNHPSPDYVHMQELMHGKDEFSTERGWDDRSNSAFLERLSVFHQQKRWCERIHAVSCSIDLAARDRAVKDGSCVDDPHQICTELCVSGTEMWFAEVMQNTPGKIVVAESADFFFDRNEDFIGWFQKLWQQHTRHKRDLFWGRINTIAPIEMRKNPPLQAADILAWCIGRTIAYGDHKNLCSTIMNAIPRTSWYLGYDALVKPNRTLWTPRG